MANSPTGPVPPNSEALHTLRFMGFLRLNYIKAPTEPLNLTFLSQSCSGSDCRKKLFFDDLPSEWIILDFPLWLLLFCPPTYNISYNKAIYGNYYKTN